MRHPKEAALAGLLALTLAGCDANPPVKPSPPKVTAPSPSEDLSPKTLFDDVDEETASFILGSIIDAQDRLQRGEEVNIIPICIGYQKDEGLHIIANPIYYEDPNKPNAGVWITFRKVGDEEGMGQIGSSASGLVYVDGDFAIPDVQFAIPTAYGGLPAGRMHLYTVPVGDDWKFVSQEGNYFVMEEVLVRGATMAGDFPQLCELFPPQSPQTGPTV